MPVKALWSKEQNIPILRINFAHFIYGEKASFFRLKIVFMSLFFSFGVFKEIYFSIITI